jgi:hypothetical protein
MTKFSFFRSLGVPHTALVLTLLAASSLPLASCKRDHSSAAPREAAGPPTLRIYALSGAAGAVEPCGCVKDMLGGVDHAAAFIAAEKKKVPHALVLGAGPMFFENPEVEPTKKDQQLFKAEAMAQSLSDVGLVAWAPGANDWATGKDEFARLTQQTGARALVANVKEPTPSLVSSHIEQRGDLRIGLIGISLPTPPSGPSPIDVGPAEQALVAELERLKGTSLNIALIAAPRGEALRLIERINHPTPRLQLAILGKPFDQGENNDQAISPEIVENALVVQAPNHLQAISVIDLYVRDGTSHFADGTGLSAHETQISLQSRIDELSHRLERWKAPGSPVMPSDIALKEKELGALKQQLAGLVPAERPKQGSYFLYDLVFVRESLGNEPQVSARLSAYYKRVNEHNKLVFADRAPQPAAEGQASYVGVATCTNCHVEERAFWDKTPHARAYATLATAHKEYNLDCVSCHVTGYEQPGGSTVTHVDDFKSVQCEVCHGPGSQHANTTHKDTIKGKPSRSMCASSCHHEPHVGADWSVDVAWPQIIGKGHGQ